VQSIDAEAVDQSIGGWASTGIGSDGKVLKGTRNEDGSQVHLLSAFEKEGIFIGNASCFFVPDNPNYGDSAKLLLDENDHPVSEEAYKKMTDEQKTRCQWRRCYKMVSLLHTNRTVGFFFFVALKVLPSNAHESPVLYEQVRQFVETVDKG